MEPNLFNDNRTDYISNPKSNPMKSIVYYCFIALTAIALSACSAEDGKDGIDGIDGQQGPQGEQGIPGEDGNANIIYSDWFALNTYSNKYTETIFDGTTEAIIYTFEASEITQEILDKGSLNVYFEISDGYVLPLPIADYAGVGMSLYSLSLNEFRIIIYDKGNTNPGDAIIVENIKAFRYVIIPGGTPAQAIDMEKIIEQTPIQG